MSTNIACMLPLVNGDRATLGNQLLWPLQMHACTVAREQVNGAQWQERMNESLLVTANEWSHALLSVIVWLLVLHVKLCSQSLDFVLRVDHILRRWMGGEVR